MTSSLLVLTKALLRLASDCSSAPLLLLAYL